MKEKTFGNSFQTGSSTKKNTQMTFKISFFAEFHSIPNLGMGYSETRVELSAAQKLLGPYFDHLKAFRRFSVYVKLFPAFLLVGPERGLPCRPEKELRGV